MKFITNNSIKIAYYSFGSPNKPVLVLISGAGADHTIWQGQIDYLSKRYYIIAIDNRGTGKSDRPKGHYTADMLVSDLSLILDNENIQRTVLIGFSMGGLIAQKFYNSYPDRVEKLILMNCSLGGGNPDTILPKKEVINQFIFSSALSDEDIALNAIDYNFGPDFSKQEPKLFKEYFPRALKDTGAVPHQIPIMVSNEKFIEDYSSVNLPVLVILGEDDVVIPKANGEVFKKYIPHAEIRYFSGAHATMVLHYDEVNKLIDWFVQRNEPRVRIA